MTTTQRVENILAASHDARNSDKELWLIFAQKFGMNLTDQQIATFKKMPSMETIRRVRQKIQEDGRYKADPKVAKERRMKSIVMQQTTPVYKPQNIENTLTHKAISWLND